MNPIRPPSALTDRVCCLCGFRPRAAGALFTHVHTRKGVHILSSFCRSRRACETRRAAARSKRKGK